MNPKCKVNWLGEMKPDDPRYKEGWSIAVQSPKRPAPVKPPKPQGKK
jgi:hypothetical protein